MAVFKSICPDLPLLFVISLESLHLAELTNTQTLYQKIQSVNKWPVLNKKEGLDFQKSFTTIIP